MKCDPTPAGRSVFHAGAELRAERAGTAFTLRLTGARAHKGRLLVSAENVADADAAKALSGTVLYAPRDLLDVGPDEYLDADLTGCRVVGVDGKEYGVVDAVEHYPASDMLVVAGTLVPMVRAHVREIDVAARRIIIDPPAGLFE
jgi:16S rRNA processing protein RimM